MEDHASIVRNWEDMNTDILLKLFQSFDIFELTSAIPHVCSTWRMVASDPVLWGTLDLSMLKSNFIKTTQEPYIYVATRSCQTLTRVLKIALNLSRGNILTLIFRYDLYVRDDQLTYTAERCPRLKRLVMPAWNLIKKSGICSAIRVWKDLESLTMPAIENPAYLIEEIGKKCKNFAELKIMGPFDILFASALVSFLPNLKVLSLRCSMVWMNALIVVLDRLPKLEVLNISHCILIETSPLAQGMILRELDGSILEKASRLREFLTCIDDWCIMCQRTRKDEGLVRWYKYEEELWKADEVRSLSL
ncbi:unnamed protein product [Camellia sinensis]